MTRITNFGAYVKFSIECGKVVEVNKVLRHVSGQDQVYDPLAHQFVGVPVQVLQDVDPVVRRRQLEGQGCVVVLQHSNVVVHLCQVAV